MWMQNLLSAMSLQSDLSKWRISKLAKIDKLYIDYVSTRLLQRPNNDFIQYKNKIFPYNSHINLRSCDAASSYHCYLPITGWNITKWDCIFNFLF